MEGSSLLIADGQYTDEGTKQRSIKYPRATTLVDLAMAADVPTGNHSSRPNANRRNVDVKIQYRRDRAAAIGYTGMIFGAREVSPSSSPRNEHSPSTIDGVLCGVLTTSRSNHLWPDAF